MKIGDVLPWLLLAASLLYIGVCTGGSDSEALARAEAERDSAFANAERLQAVKDSIDAHADSVIRQKNRRIEVLASRAESADTVFRATVDTIRAALPDTLHATLEGLVAAHEKQVESLRGQIEALHSIVQMKDNQLAARDSLIRGLRAAKQAEEAVSRELRKHKDSPFEKVVRAGVCIGVGTQQPFAGVGCAADMAVDALW